MNKLLFQSLRLSGFAVRDVEGTRPRALARARLGNFGLDTMISTRYVAPTSDPVTTRTGAAFVPTSMKVATLTQSSVAVASEPPPPPAPARDNMNVAVSTASDPAPALNVKTAIATVAFPTATNVTSSRAPAPTWTPAPTSRDVSLPNTPSTNTNTGTNTPGKTVTVGTDGTVTVSDGSGVITPLRNEASLDTWAEDVAPGSTGGKGVNPLVIAGAVAAGLGLYWVLSGLGVKKKEG